MIAPDAKASTSGKTAVNRRLIHPDRVPSAFHLILPRIISIDQLRINWRGTGRRSCPEYMTDGEILASLCTLRRYEQGGAGEQVS